MTVELVPLTNEENHAIQQRGELGAMLDWQHELSTMCGSYGPATGENDGWYDALKNNAIQLVVEAGEVASHYSNETKRWKSKYPDLSKVDEEMIDVMHYALTYFNIRNMSAYEIAVRYRAKNNHNYTRVSERLKVTT